MEMIKMPKITFLNLNVEKRDKIKKAIINEFSRHTIAKEIGRAHV